MTQIGHFLCLLLGCLIGHFIVYVCGKIWDFATSKHVEVPEIKYDVADNPILSLKNRLGQAYVASHDQSVKKLLHRLLEYVEVIEEWHKSKINLAENKCNTYRTRAARAEVELATERSKNEELTKQLKDAELKNEQLRQILKLNIGKPFFTPQDWQNTYGKEPIPVGTVKAEEALKQSIPMNTGAIIHIDSEDLNRYSVGRGPDGNLLKDEPQIKNEEFIKQLRDWWGLEASKAVELPNADKATRLRENALRMMEATSYPHSTGHGKPEYMTSEEMQEHYQKVLYVKYKDEPLKCYSVSVYKNDGIRAMFTNWELCAPGITAIERVLSEDGIKAWDYKEMP